jgi:hypothetical protein
MMTTTVDARVITLPIADCKNFFSPMGLSSQVFLDSNNVTAALH